MAGCEGIITDERYLDTGRSDSVHETLHIVRIEAQTVGPLSVFVFWLI
jgi:hypothetical protein